MPHGDELADYNGVFALFRNEAAMVSVPVDLADSLHTLLMPEASAHSPESLAMALRPVATATIGPAWIGYAEEVPAPVHSARALNTGDAAALQSLQGACAATEWEHGGSSLDQPCSGVFADGQLAAVAGYEIWGGVIAHISVVTHPEFRSRGSGRSAVAHVAGRALAAGLLPQYRTLEANAASIHIAQALGFTVYATSMAVRL